MSRITRIYLMIERDIKDSMYNIITCIKIKYLYTLLILCFEVELHIITILDEYNKCDFNSVFCSEAGCVFPNVIME
jgi:hypothetical protein